MSIQRPNKQASPAGGNGPIVGLLIGLGVLLVALLAVGAARLAGLNRGGNLGDWLKGNDGDRWSGTATVNLVCIAALLIPLVGCPAWWWWRARRGRTWADPLARSMSHRRDLASLRQASVGKDTARLGSQKAGRGVPLGTAVATGERLYSTYEWAQMWIMGPRAGKTRSVAVPQILNHGGAVVTTSNKPDVHYLTRGPRSEVGVCWASDPQGIAGQDPTWWWNPLTYVTSVERAAKLVAVWAAARSDDETSASDPYFEPEGRNLLSCLLMAAALSGEPITRLRDWLTGQRPLPGVPDPCVALRSNGFDIMAAKIEEILGLADEQRDGLYGTASSFVSFLNDPRYLPWLGLVDQADRRPQFDPAAFVRSADTLYLLSKEGPGSSRAITGALTAAVYAAAEGYSEECGGRVPTPILFLLDEAANVCRWPELPQLYSHAGSRGVVLVTILQSKPQGERTWGKLGFGEMWSATNILCLGSGINDDDTLSSLSRLIGDRQYRDRSTSTGTKGHHSTSTQIREERILAESDLRALPRGRAVLLSPGARAILLGTIDYSTYEWAWKVEASRQAYQHEQSPDDTPVVDHATEDAA